MYKNYLYKENSRRRRNENNDIRRGTNRWDTIDEINITRGKSPALWKIRTHERFHQINYIAKTSLKLIRASWIMQHNAPDKNNVGRTFILIYPCPSCSQAPAIDTLAPLKPEAPRRRKQSQTVSGFFDENVDRELRNVKLSIQKIYSECAWTADWYGRARTSSRETA
jgi:hypothetical protein